MDGALVNTAPGGTLNVTGTCDDGAGPGIQSVTISENGSPLGTATLTPTGTGTGCTWTFAYTVGATAEDGVSHTLSAVASDGTNTQSPAATVTFTVDNVAPAAPALTGTAPASPTSDASVTVDATVPCDAVSITVSDTANGTTSVAATQVITAPAGCSGTYTVTVSDVGLVSASNADTVNSLTATVEDAAGNTSAPSAALSVTQDSTIPSITSATVNATAEKDIPQPPGGPQPAFQNVPASTAGALVFNFSEAMNPSSIGSATVTMTDDADGSSVAPTCGMAAGDTALDCSTNALKGDHVYTLTFNNSGVLDTSNPGNQLDKTYTWKVYMAQAASPYVVSSTPANLARAVAVTTSSITVTFNEGMDADSATGTNSVTNPANYALEDCYLANASTTPEAGCSTIAISSVDWDASKYTATLHPASALDGYYHTYKVTVQGAVQNLSGGALGTTEPPAPAAATNPFLYTNVNRLPTSTQSASGVPYTVYSNTPAGGTQIGQVNATLMTAAEDPDHNPLVVWYDCKSQYLTLSIWDGDSQFVNLPQTSLGQLGTCTNGTDVANSSGVLPPIRDLAVGVSPGADSNNALFKFYVAGVHYQFASLFTKTVEDDAVSEFRIARSNRWTYATGTSTSVETFTATFANPSDPYRVALAMDTTRSNPLPVLAVADNAGIHDDVCTAAPCTGLSTNNGDWTVNATFDASTAATKTSSISALIDGSENLIVPYTTSNTTSGNLYFSEEALKTGTVVKASTQLESADPDGDVSSVLWNGSGGVALGALVDDSQNFFVRSVAGPLSSAPFTASGVKGSSLLPTLGVYPDASGGASGALQTAVAAFRSGTGGIYTSVQVATSTDFSTWTSSVVDSTAEPVSATSTGGLTAGASGLVVFQGGDNAGQWGLFYLGQDQTQGVGQLYYRQQ